MSATSAMDTFDQPAATGASAGASTGSGSGSGFDVQDIIDWFSSLTQGLSGFSLSPEQIDQFASILPILGLYSQMQDQDYKNQALQVLAAQNDVDKGQLDLAKQQLEFQQGEYWDWYKNDFFPAQIQMSNNQLAMSNDQVAMSKNQLGISDNALQSSLYDVAKSKDYALAQGYGAQAAKDQADIAHYQYLLQTTNGGGMRPRTAPGYGYQGG